MNNLNRGDIRILLLALRTYVQTVTLSGHVRDFEVAERCDEVKAKLDALFESAAEDRRTS
jgi:hypothetical protein